MVFELDTENVAMAARTSGLGPASATVLVLVGMPDGHTPDRLNRMFETVEAVGSGADGGTLGD